MLGIVLSFKHILCAASTALKGFMSARPPLAFWLPCHLYSFKRADGTTARSKVSSVLAQRGCPRAGGWQLSLKQSLAATHALEGNPVKKFEMIAQVAPQPLWRNVPASPGHMCVKPLCAKDGPALRHAQHSTWHLRCAAGARMVPKQIPRQCPGWFHTSTDPLDRGVGGGVVLIIKQGGVIKWRGAASVRVIKEGGRTSSRGGVVLIIKGGFRGVGGGASSRGCSLRRGGEGASSRVGASSRGGGFLGSCGGGFFKLLQAGRGVERDVLLAGAHAYRP